MERNKKYTTSSLHKKDMVDYIYEHMIEQKENGQWNKVLIHQILTLWMELLSQSLALGKTVHLVRFGSFAIRKRKATKKRLPFGSREVVEIPPKNIVQFRVSRYLDEKINS